MVNSLAAFDQLSLTGGATLNGGLTVNVNLGNAAQSGTYTLVNAPAGLTLNGNTVTPNITVGGAGQTRLSGSLSETATQIDLLVAGGAANLTWTGAQDATTWDVVNHTNWMSTAAAGNPNQFFQADNVLLTNNTSNLTINITAAVQPSSVTFSNDASHNYVINSSSGNGIGGSGNLTVGGAGSVTLNEVNTYTGSTNVNSGNLIIGGSGAIGGSTLNIASGATTSVNSGGTISTTAINVSGSLTVNGTVGGTTMILSSPANATVDSGGTINTTTVNVNGGSLNVQSGGNLASTTIAVANGASLTVQSGASLPVAPNLTNNGTVTIGSDQTVNMLTGTDPTAVLFQTGNLTVNASGTYAGAIKDGAGTGNLNVNGGTLVITGANSYTGTTNINSGAGLVLDNASNTGTISASSTLSIGGTFVYARTDSPTFANVLNGNGAFRQIGGGTMTLTADNSGYSGAIQVYNGTVVQGLATALGTGGNLVLGTPGNGTTTTAVGNLILSAAVSSTTFSSIGATNSNLTTNPTPNVLTIPAGVTATDNGTLTVGPNSGTIFTTLNATGGGTLVVNGTITIAQSNVATLDLSGLNSVTINNSAVNVANNAAALGVLTLANTTVGGIAPSNSISTGTLNISTPSSGTGIEAGGVSALTLGSGTNVIGANTINVGIVRGLGVIQFPAGAPPTASLTITGQGGGNANINIGTESGNGPAGVGTSALLLAGHPVNVQAGGLIVATATSNQGTILVAANVTFDTGTFNVANQILVGAITGTGVDTSGVTGDITIGGAAPNTTATGVFSTSAGITLGDFTNSQSATAPAVVTATFTVNGGTASIGGNIVNVSTHGTTNSTVNLNSGTLEMNGNSIGGSGAVNSGTGPVTVNFPAAGFTATLGDLGGGGINGNGLTMASAGTLQLSGNSSYSGVTNAQSGTLLTLGDSARTEILNGNGANITGGRLVFDYNNGGTDPATQVSGILTAGFGQSPQFSSGQLFTSNTPDAHKGLGWFDNTTTGRLTVRYTWFGDANLDGIVNALDFNALATNFGASVGSQVWQNGDFNYDGLVDTSDFMAMLPANFGQDACRARCRCRHWARLVPEPGMLWRRSPGAGSVDEA